GTGSTLPHLGQRACFPAASGGTRSLLPHRVHKNSIAMFFSTVLSAANRLSLADGQLVDDRLQ
ncbi:MAG: hypothetical protein D6741_19210, partial [Planctomycetota bacterium]